MKYENVPCPICKEEFKADSDVVVCPDCGTPCHRECYAKQGYCVNEGKHGTDFVWMSPIDTSKKESDSSASAKTEAPRMFADRASSNVSQSAPNGAVPTVEIDREGRAIAGYRAITGKEKIGENTVEEYGKVIQKNVHKFIPKFFVMEKTGKKYSWNWAAFIFGPFWLFYRKMYKYGLIALLISAIIPCVFVGDSVKYADEYSKVYTEMFEIMLSDADITQEELNEKVAEITKDAPTPTSAMSASEYVQLAVCIALGIFGNALYKDHCAKLLKKTKSQSLSPEETDAVLARRGGRSALRAILGYALFVALNALAVYVFMRTGMDIASLIKGVI